MVFAEASSGFLLRASAASRISSLAHLHGAQANKDASKPEAAEASPFAILVQSAAPKNDTKPSLRDEQQKQDEKSAAAPADKSGRDTAKPEMAEARPAKSPTDVEGSKPVEEKPETNTDEVPADPSLLAADMPQPEIPPAPQFQPQPQLVAAAATPDRDGEEDMTAAPAIGAPSPALGIGAPSAAPAAAAPSAPRETAPEIADAEAAPQPAELAQSAQPTQPQAQTPEGSSQAVAAAPQPSPIPTAPQPATTQAVPPQQADIQTAAAVAAETQPAAAPNTQPAADTDAAKPGARKVQSQAGKDSGKDNSDETQPSLARRDTQAFDIAFAAAPKSQPQAQAQVTPDTGMAVHGISAAPAQPASSSALLPQQQVQVTAEPPKPNMPVLAVEIAARTQSGARQFDIRLDPPELGRVEVRLSIDATGKASAHLSADQPQTLDLLQKDAPLLARALRDAGLNVAQDGLNFSLRQQAQNQDQNGGTPRGFGRGQRLTAIASIETAPAPITIRANGRLDIRV